MKNAEPMLVGTTIPDLGRRRYYFADEMYPVVAKVMRHLAALSDVREVSSDRYVHSKYSRELAKYPLEDAFKYMYVPATPGVAFPCGFRTDDFIASKITTEYGETHPSGWQTEAGSMVRDTPASFTLDFPKLPGSNT